MLNELKEIQSSIDKKSTQIQNQSNPNEIKTQQKVLGKNMNKIIKGEKRLNEIKAEKKLLTGDASTEMMMKANKKTFQLK